MNSSIIRLLTKQNVVAPNSYLKLFGKLSCVSETTSSSIVRSVTIHSTLSQRMTRCSDQMHSVLSKSIHTADLIRKEIGYTEFLKLKKSGLTVIDVRDNNEIKSSGTIPGSLNIPLKQIKVALKTSPDDFKVKYGRSKPKENQSVMFLCQRGVRSKAAMDQAIQIGYKKAMSFQGGWVNFSQNENN